MSDPKKVIIVDAGTRKTTGNAHTRRHFSFRCMIIERLSDTLDKEKEVITYCSGGMCDASTDAANVLAKKVSRSIRVQGRHAGLVRRE